MELFTLGAGRGYAERDARAGARADRLRQRLEARAGNVNFRFDRKRHDTGAKRIFGKRGAFDWRDKRPTLPRAPEARLVLPRRQALALLHPAAPDAGTRRSLETLYRKDFQIRPPVEAILARALASAGRGW